MPFIASHDAAVFERDGAVFTGLASPSRGAKENSVWLVSLAPHCPATPHRLTREEIFFCLEGCASGRLNGQDFELKPGCTLIVPPEVVLELGNPHASPFRAIAVLPVGGQAIVGENPPFTPPWAV